MTLRTLLGAATLIGITTAAIGTTVCRADPLSAYLAAPNPDFAWKEVSRRALAGGAQLVELQLTSQKWHGIVWRHHLLVVEPKPAAFKKGLNAGLLFITGSYDQGLTAQFLAPSADQIGAPVAVLYDVPNQPLFGDLREDALIAYTFLQYLQTRDATWPLLFPMTKSAVAAMTALQQFSTKDPTHKIDRFVVAGASKRGWTTYLTGASDPRVIGIVPMVFNNLNINAQMPHQIATWGKYSEEIQDYVKTGLVGKQATPAGQELVQMVDPYTFRASLSMPKLLIHGTNDRYWALDAADFYYGDLPGDKHLLYVPNAQHNLNADLTRVQNATEAFFTAVAAGARLPQITSTTQLQNGIVHLTARSSQTPAEMVVWIATSLTGDFRDSHWASHPMRQVGDHFEYDEDAPPTGHVALFAEARFGAGDPHYMESSSLYVYPRIPAA